MLINTPRFLTDYIHTTIIVILCLYLTIKTFQHESVGSIGGLYDLVVAAQDEHKIAGNYQESILTMTSKEGINFAIILLVSNFGCVIVSKAHLVDTKIASVSNMSRWIPDTSSRRSLHLHPPSSPAISQVAFPTLVFPGV
jgi:Na+/proline symporter